MLNLDYQELFDTLSNQLDDICNEIDNLLNEVSKEQETASGKDYKTLEELGEILAFAHHSSSVAASELNITWMALYEEEDEDQDEDESLDEDENEE